MLKRVYVDNFRCLVNFELTLDRLELILGVNGTGKSTVFEVLANLRDFVDRAGSVATLFPRRSLTRWQTRPIQRFEIEIEGNGGLYRYSLEIEHQAQSSRPSRVAREELFYRDQDGEKQLFAFTTGTVQLYGDDGSKGPTFPLDASWSGLAAVVPGGDNRRLTWFKERLQRIYVLRIDPRVMTPQSDREERRPNAILSNFVSWYRGLHQRDPAALMHLWGDLGRVIEGFASIRFELQEFGGAADDERHAVLFVDVKAAPEGTGGDSLPMPARFDELSDGQRALIALYALLHGALTADATLCIDEPENFVALREIQPWLNAVIEKALTSRNETQAILISHHPEVMDQLARERGRWFYRVGGAHVRVKRFNAEADEPLPPSELVARDWVVDE